jgi:hypothetical protein
MDLKLALKLNSLHQYLIQKCSIQSVYFTKFLKADPKIK